MKLTRAIKRNRRCFGLRGIALAFRELFTTEPAGVGIFSTHIGRKIQVRVNTTDISVYNQVFIHREYDFPVAQEPKIIVDAGANIGLSSIYFSMRFPGARIYALEPERSNYDLLAKNVSPCANVIPVNKALWSETTRLSLLDPGSGRAGLQKDGFQTFKAESESLDHPDSRIDAVDLDTFMREHGIDHIDLLKIDIEGSEREVFQHPGEWIARVGILVVELHDRMRPGCSRAFFNATNHFENEIYKGENVIVARRGLLGPGAGGKQAAKPAGTQAMS
ncbi:MAG: FkbM family methyltransferase [Gammaproteobacteria bacterium]|nr:FkbM family methyltransferase [Gammaproteobacteria bacterium]MDH5511919.1 FkbM family methyltransferase [Gammaproteobacteria bacterium]